MSFETGTAIGVGDLLVKWFDFLQANGWTADVDWVSASQSPTFGIIQRKNQLSPENELTVNLHCGFCIGDVWDGADTMVMIPMRDYVSGAPEDAIEVATKTDTYRNSNQHIPTNFPSSPFENYWFFESDYYAYAVVEYATGFFRHFGMGSLTKTGKWFGGDFYYGHNWEQATNRIDVPLATDHFCLMDSAGGDLVAASVMYGKQIDGSPFPDVAGRQSPETAWHACTNTGDSGVGISVDADGRDRGGLFTNCPRGGFHYPFQWIGRSPFNGYRPMNPMTVFTWYSGSNPDNFIPLGAMPDIRNISMMDDLLPGDEFTVGSDTWIAFPLTRRRPLLVADDTEQSLSWGVAYKKVLT